MAKNTRPDTRGKRKGKGIAAAGKTGPSPALIAGILVVVLFAAAVGFGIYYSQKSATQAAGAIPAGASAAGSEPTGILVGNANAATKIDIYLDFQCPVCKAYEAQSGPTIDQYVASGKAKVIYHPLAFLDRYSSTQYSTRSSAASGCASDAGVFLQYLKLLYANQPPENGNGLPEDQLVSLAKQAGAPDSVGQCITANTYAGWTANVTDAASKANITGTPTIMVNGKQIDNSQAALEAAVG